MSRSYVARGGQVLLALASIPLLGYLLLVGASNVRVSGGLAGIPNNLIDKNIVWNIIRDAGRSRPWLPQPRVTRVERVNASDALRNAVYTFCVSGLTALLLVVMFIAGVARAVFGVFTADWGTLGTGVLMAVLAPIFAIGSFFLPF